ncbi:MAG TPA: ABC transporter permease [Candidatus Acidoferrales bacterium]|nr:ABC transporter permease [Candidatus Acidoferrales bacterium]
MTSILQDLRYGVRVLTSSPAFTGIAIITLALGIGANTAIFSAVNGIILKPLPYANPSQLIRVVSSRMNGDLMLQAGVSTADAQDIKAQCPAIADVTTYSSSAYTYTGQSAPEKLSGTAVEGNFFSLLGVRPLLGRTIEPPDTTPGHGDVVLLSHAVWRNIFGGDSGWIGRQVTLSGKRYGVIGVMPPSFDYGGPEFSGTVVNNLVWLPREIAPNENSDRDSRDYYLVARLKPRATVSEAQSQLKTLAARLASAYPKTDGIWDLHGASLKEFKVGYLSQPLLLLLGAVGFVLLIACVNVSGLLLARSWGRHKEVAIREALGATRFRIIRQFLSESLLLALAGGALGVLLAVWGVEALRIIAPPNTPRLDEVQLSPPVLWFTLGASVLAGIFFGLAPAVQVSGRRIGAVLKESLGGSPGTVSGRRPRRLRSALVIVEVALAVILVVGATLIARSFKNLTAVDLGFRPDHLLTMTVKFSKAVCDPDAKENFAPCALAAKDVLARVQSLPGVKTASEVSGIPLVSNGIAMSLSIEGQSQQLGFGTGSPIWYRDVTPDYFAAMGIRLLQGRFFSDADVQGADHVAIVNESFAKKFLGGRPLGRRISQEKDKKTGQPEWLNVIGEVSDNRDFALEISAEPEFYSPYVQGGAQPNPSLLLRTSDDPLALVAAVKNQVAAVDKSAPVTDVKTMDQVLSEQMAQPRFQTLLLGAFGALGFLLAVVGIYGVISYDISQRTREIGVRMALGAQPEHVLRMIIREAMLLAACGIFAGIAGALALGRVLQSSLYEIKPTDPLTFVAVAIVLSIVALVACYVPARRAMRVDPMIALRYE